MRVLILAAAALAAAATAAAAPSNVILRGAIQADVNYDWNSSGALFDSLANPLSISITGPSVSASMPAGAFIRYDQGAVPNDFNGGWNGNFSPNAHLLFTDDSLDQTNFGPITFTFSTPIYGFGTQFQSVDQEYYTASIQVYNASNTLLGTFTQSGFSNNHADGSALFLGVIDPAAGFSKVVLSVTTASGYNPFAINTLSFNVAHPEMLAVVPEPCSLVLWLVGGSLLLCLRRRSHRFYLAHERPAEPPFREAKNGTPTAS